jgi:glycerophosphoryl diester phosphodiesterase
VPENTLAAFHLALRQGAGGLESDVWLARDGVPVLVHDDVIYRDGREIHVREENAENLRGLGVPSLEDFYQACGVDFAFSLDLQHPEAALPVLEVAARAGAEHNLWLCYDSISLLGRLREASPRVHAVHSTRRKNIHGPLAAHARLLAGSGVEVLNMHWMDWTPRLVRAVQRAGVKAFAWDAQTPAVIQHTAALGVDAIYSDYPDVLVGLVKNFGS